MKPFLLVLALLLGAVPHTHALYDPKPTDFLALVEGEWTGALKYRDYSLPHGLVTLPATLYASLAGPDKLTLHYVFDDGPGKIVHSYETLEVDLVAKTLRWSGTKPDDVTVCQITSVKQGQDGCGIVAEQKQTVEGKQQISRYTLHFGAGGFESTKEEAQGTEILAFRDGYKFERRKKN